MFEYRYKTDLKTRYLTAIHFFVFIAIALAKVDSSRINFPL